MKTRPSLYGGFAAKRVYHVTDWPLWKLAGNREACPWMKAWIVSNDEPAFRRTILRIWLMLRRVWQCFDSTFGGELDHTRPVRSGF